MLPNLIIVPEAQLDVNEAYSCYEDCQSGLGEAFLNCVETCAQGICQRPEMYPVIYKSYRRALLNRFPYALFYEFVSDRIVIYGIFHTSMHDKRWKERLN